MTSPSQTAPETIPGVSIRARPPSPRRLSRKALLAGALAAGAIIAFALVAGLSERRGSNGQERSETAAAGGPPDSIEQASAQYDALELQPPEQNEAFDIVWGERGPPHERQDAELDPPADRTWSAAPEHERTQTASAAPARAPDPEDEARVSPILFDLGRRAETGTDAVLDAALAPPPSPHMIQAGAVIPAALVTGLNSDLPGRVIAQVTAPVYDSITGDHLLIPQGARLIGAYDNVVRYGDRRILLSWDRLVLPNGWSIALERMPATDPSGAAGLSDRADHHLDRLAVAIGLSAIVSVIANEAEDDDEDSNSLSPGVADAAAQQAAETGGRIVDRELQVRPTITVRPGASVRILVTRDIVLRPYPR